MLLFWFLGCTTAQLESELRALEDQLEKLEDENEDLAEAIEEMQDGGDTGDSGEPQGVIVPVSVIFSLDSTRLSDGSYDYRHVWQVEGDVEAVRTTLMSSSVITTTGELCGEADRHSSEADVLWMVETWSASGYQCWSRWSSVWPSCTSPVQVATLTCEST